MFFEIFLSLLVIGVVKYWLKGRKMDKAFEKFPSPPTIPLLGNLLVYPRDPVDIFKVMMNLMRIHGRNVVTRGLFLDMTLMVTEKKDVEALLTSNRATKKSREYTFMIPWLGTGLLISDSTKWFQRRKIITPTFHFNILEQFINTFNKQVDILIEKLHVHNDNVDFDIYKYVTLCTLDIICETSMGIDIKAQTNSSQDYVQAVKGISLIIFKRIFSVARQFPWVFNISYMGREQVKLIKTLHEFTDRVIQTRKEYLEKNPEKVDDVNEFGIKRKMTFLDILLHATIDGKSLSNEDIREEVDTFMFEGHDTTASGISFLLYHLAENQDVQEKAFEEIRTVYGDDQNTPVTYNSLQELKYLDMVFKESMRLHPPVPIMGRWLLEDTLIDGVMVPPHTNVLIPVYAVHRDPDVFPNPEKFDPERFSPENSANRSPYSYIPFSAGPRNCIGQRFATLEVKTAVSKILRHYKLLPSECRDELRVQADLVLKTPNGIKIRMEQRKYE